MSPYLSLLVRAGDLKLSFWYGVASVVLWHFQMSSLKPGDQLEPILLVSQLEPNFIFSLLPLSEQMLDKLIPAC